MYAADTEDAAIAETLLHNIPAEGGLLPYDQLRAQNARPAASDPRRAPRPSCTAWDYAASRSPPTDLTSSPASTYAHTVRWAEAAHEDRSWTAWCGCRGCATAPRRTSSSATGGADGFRPGPTHARIFASPADQIWLIDLCAPLHVDVLIEAVAITWPDQPVGA